MDLCLVSTLVNQNRSRILINDLLLLHFGDQEHHCADEHHTCNCNGTVKYGFDQMWTEQKVVAGSIPCTNEVFGDIAIGKDKECRCNPTSK